MASDEDRDDSVLDLHRTSLLETIEDRNRTLNKKQIVHRILLISKLKVKETEEDTEVDRNEVGKHFENLLKNMHSQNEPVTGVMLIYMKQAITMLETSSENLLEILREQLKDQELDRGYQRDMKILSIAHDVPARLYQQMSFRTLDILEHNLEAYEPTESTERLVADTVGQMIRLGCYLAKQPKLNLKNAMDSLHEKVPEMLPQQGAIYYLLNENDSVMLTPQELIQMYKSPFDVVLDSDLVWPLPVKLFPYN